MTKLGCHYPNAMFRGMSDFWSLPWTCLTVLSEQRADIPKIREHFPSARILMRAYLSNWYTTEPHGWAQQIAEWAEELRPFGVEWTFANEQNLKGEGHPQGAGDGNGPYPPRSLYEDVLNWNLDVIRDLRRLCPWMVLHFPALSQGHSDDSNDAGYVGFDILRPAVEACDVLDVHTYWEADIPSAGYDNAWFGRRYERPHAMFPEKPLFISECAAHLPSSPNAPSQIRAWLRALPAYIGGATFFIWDSDAANQDWTLYNRPAIIDVFREGDTVPLEPLDPAWPELQIERFAHAGGYWKLTDHEVIKTQGGEHSIWLQTYKDGQPVVGVVAEHFWPQSPGPYAPDSPEHTAVSLRDVGGGNMQPVAEFIMGGDGQSNFDAQGHGPHNVRLLTASDTLYGCGLPMNEHRKYRFVFEWADNPVPPTPGTLKDAALAAAKTVKWMPVNHDAALWKWAKAHGLEDAQTDEIEFAYGGKTYVLQVFNLGIVYVAKGDWSNVQVIPK